jgi:hypothetical protein
MAQIGCYQVIRAGQKPAETAQNQTIVAMFGEEDCVRVGWILGQIGDEDDRAWLVDRLAEPWLRRARRLAERDARIREYALAFHPLLSGRAMASAIAVAIQRYRVSAWRFENDLPAPADARRGVLWRILHLNSGKSLSAGSVRNALAGVVVVSGQKKPGKLATETATPPGLGSKSGTSGNVGGGEAAH